MSSPPYHVRQGGLRRRNTIEAGMSKKDSKPEKAGSERRAVAERQEAEDNVKQNMERLRALRQEREAQKKH
jgi:hypothetical protein